MSIDISDIAKVDHDYAVHLAGLHGLIVYERGMFEIEKVVEYTSFEAVDLWRDLSLSAEVLLKACLLKHHVAFFRKRANCEYGEKVTALTDPWLQRTLDTLQIDYVAEINTGTVSTALKSAEMGLFSKLAVDRERSALISEMFYIIIRTRRNRNSHFFFPNQGRLDIAEVETLFLPLLNLLEEIYRS